MSKLADSPDRKLRKQIILIGASVAFAVAALFVAYVVLLALISYG
jgi:hypothetical protein